MAHHVPGQNPSPQTVHENGAASTLIVPALLFAYATWANYRAQFGKTRQIGDDRELVDGHTRLEAFADRISEDGLEK